MKFTVSIFLKLFIIALVSLKVLSAACHAEEIRLSATPGLSGVIDILSDNYVQKNRGVKIVKDYAASAHIAKQLEHGENIDIVIVPSSRITGILIEKNILEERSITAFATNRLIFVGKHGLKLRGMQDLLNLGRIAVGDPAIVASGEYAYQAINRAGLEKELRNRLIKTRDDRESLYLVKSGKADGAFLNKTDYINSGIVLPSFEIPSSLYPRITYIAAMTPHGKADKNVVTFYRYLHSEQVHNILSKNGLGI